MKSADVEKGGELRVTHGAGAFSLRLSDRATAEKWALKIRYPKSLFDKLGLQRESRFAVLGVDDAEFLTRAAERQLTPPLARLGGSARFHLSRRRLCGRAG